MSSVQVGPASVALIEKHDGAHAMGAEFFTSRLAMILDLIDNGAIGRPDIGYGSDGHKAALSAIEKKIAQVRANIARREIER